MLTEDGKKTCGCCKGQKVIKPVIGMKPNSGVLPEFIYGPAEPCPVCVKPIAKAPTKPKPPARAKRSQPEPAAPELEELDIPPFLRRDKSEFQMNLF